MKYVTGLLFIFVIAVMLAGAACRSATGRGASGNAKKLLVGKWKIVKVTTEPSDNTPGNPADAENVTVTFKNDGTGGSAWPSGGSTFTWAVTGGDSCIQITDAATTLVNALYITKMSASSFTVKDTSTHPAQWETFTKQDDK